MDLPFVDLDQMAFSAQGSRFVVRRVPNGVIEVLHVRYEVPLQECVAVRLTPRARMTGSPLPTDGALRCAKDGEVPTRISAVGGHLRIGSTTLIILGEEVRILLPSDGVHHLSVGNAPDVGVVVGPDRADIIARDSLAHQMDDAAFLREADAVVDRWMARVPCVSASREAMTRQCWWVLGSNIVELSAPASPRGSSDNGCRKRSVVVPSKLGYVALWQWDAYFIALGLRHGALDLAIEQLDVAFTPSEDGQLPDVIHDCGMLSSSADLPDADRARLEASGSRSAGKGTVPLTKPPLAVWAADRVLAGAQPEERLRWMALWYPVLRDSANWWFRAGDSDGDGVPEYAHPYSSGLDDSPVFDGALPVVTPDLLAYLISQDEALAAWIQELESPGLSGSIPARSGEQDPTEATILEVRRLRERALASRQALENLWDPQRAMYAPWNCEGSVLPRTIVSLLALLAGQLPKEHVAALVSDCKNPARFGGNHPLATVSRDEAQFDPQTMWRGPVWVNTNYLVAEGLERCGHASEARRLRTSTLDQVERAGGPVEYVDPRTGVRAEHATTNFGWSAALFVDLAVREAAEGSGQRV